MPTLIVGWDCIYIIVSHEFTSAYCVAKVLV